MTEHYPCRVCILVEVEDDDKFVQCDQCDHPTIFANLTKIKPKIKKKMMSCFKQVYFLINFLISQNIPYKL